MFDRLVNPTRMIYRAPYKTDYWIQWTMKDKAAALWAYDLEINKVVKILEVRDEEFVRYAFFSCYFYEYDSGVSNAPIHENCSGQYVAVAGRGLFQAG
jgi:hypothetical protein